jgi:hypothetical protein
MKVNNKDCLPIPRARLATLAEIRRDVLPLWINPIPSTATLRTWFANDGVQRLKANPTCKRGGGPVYYSLADVEKSFRRRIVVSSKPNRDEHQDLKCS